MAKTKEKTKKEEKKEKRSAKAPKRILRKVESTEDGVSFVSEPETSVTPTQEEATTKGGKARKSTPTSSEGEVRVISFDRIVLSKKWTGALGVSQGDTLKVRLEEGSLILTK